MIKGYAASEAKGKLTPFEYEAAPIGPQDVEVKITHCGICHSDVHMIDNDWKVAEYPLVPGHEIIGTVTEAGSEVKDLKVGQRVGVGWQRSACLNCDLCVTGSDNICRSNEATIVGHHGGFADRIRTDSRFTFPIPEELASENAAPLLCGGATVYSPLKRYGVRANMRVGVMGIGGLGHLAVQFAAAMGCEVVAISHSASKKDEAMAFGASGFLDTSDAGALKEAEGSFDFILSTINVGGDWSKYLALLGPNATLGVVGVAPEVTLPVFPFIANQLTFCGSAIAGRGVMREMLAFSARHNVVAKTEAFPMSQVNEALDHLRAGKARYRVVLVNE